MILGVSFVVYVVHAGSCDETPCDLVKGMGICHSKGGIKLLS